MTHQGVKQACRGMLLGMARKQKCESHHSLRCAVGNIMTDTTGPLTRLHCTSDYCADTKAVKGRRRPLAEDLIIGLPLVRTTHNRAWCRLFRRKTWRFFFCFEEKAADTMATIDRWNLLWRTRDTSSDLVRELRSAGIRITSRQEMPSL